MDHLNYIKILFTLMTTNIVVLGGLINSIEEKLPIFIRQTFRYGKFAYKGNSKSLIKPIEVPKAWYKHFYIFSSFLSSITLYLVIDTYILNNAISIYVLQILDAIAGVERQATVTPVAVLVAIALLTIQCYRRLYDTQYVSVFGNSNINVVHYILGYIHYAGTILAILAEAPKFSSISTLNLNFQWSDVSYKEAIASMIFLWAWWHQYLATKILGNLRKNKSGKIVSKKHYLPEGSLFEYVSSPHLLCEILMYLSLTIILWKNSTFFYVFIWVLFNQAEVAVLNQAWYKNTFSNYPTNRKILIPYIF